ncbi:MAG: DNA primase [Marinilabiliaceae bacterium]|nr:DNA primase [Marinilabiliaceae bacterium]
MISEKTTERIKSEAEAKIVDIISDYVKLQKRGANYVGCCPFHNEKTGSFYVSATKSIYKCFGCGKAGNAITFVMEHDHLSFPEALRSLANRFGIEIEEKAESQEEKERRTHKESLMLICDYVGKEFEKALWESQEGQTLGLGYFRHRGLTDETIRKFHLGYSPQQRTYITTRCQNEGYKLENLVDAGVTICGENNYTSDRYRDRVTFPIMNVSGKIIGFAGRIVVNKENTGKYINSPETELYHKSDVLFGLNIAKESISKENNCFLAEGYMDIISMHQAGITNIVAPCGTALTEGQISLIKRFTNNVTLINDSDKAGISGSMKDIDLFLKNGMNVKVIILPTKDPDEFAQSHNLDEIKDFFSKNELSIPAFKARVLLQEAQNDPLKLTAAATNIVKSISYVQDRVLRELYIKESSKLLNVSENTLYSTLRDMMGQNAREAVSIIERDNKMRYSYQPQYQTIPASNTQQFGQPATSQKSSQQAEVDMRKHNNPFWAEEHELMRFFMCYMEKQIITDEKEESVSVGDYITEALYNDQYQSLNPLFNTIFEIYRNSDKGNITQNTYLSCPDPEIAQLAVNMTTPTTTLSRLFQKKNGENSSLREKDNVAEKTTDNEPENEEEKHLNEYVPFAVNQIRFRIVEKKIEELTNEITNADSESVVEMMRNMQLWMEVKQNLAKKLGERISFR